MPEISVIVPVYNTEKYLSECIESILNQTYTDFELILVNDGSCDGSLTLCHEYEKKDRRIIVIDKENGGVSSARNAGIEKASGNWITFIDSDDWVNLDYLERLIDANKDEVDFVQSGIIYFHNDTGKEIGRESLAEGFYFERENPDQSFAMVTLPLITSPVSKLYRREKLEAYKIRFNADITYGEDRDFNLSYVSVIKSSCTTSYKGYYYRKGLSDNLSSNKDYIQLLYWDIEYCNKLRLFFKANRIDGDKTDRYLAHRVFNVYNDRLIQLSKSNKRKVRDIVELLKTIVSHEEFIWLCNNFHSVKSNKITAFIYKTKSPLLISLYLKMLG